MRTPRISTHALAVACASLGLALPGASTTAASIPAPTTYAQYLANSVIAKHPEIAALDLSAKLPKTAAPMIVASNDGRLGTAPDAAMQAATAAPKGMRNAAGDRYVVVEQLRQVSGTPIGAIRLAFASSAGADTAAFDATASAVQAYLMKHVLSEANLADAFPYTSYPTASPAQRLVDATMAKHPDLLVLGMHVSLPGRGNVMLASNIGRWGKPADEDDMRVVNTGKANYEIADDHLRYEVELVLEDAHGKNIGALGVVMPYKAGDDKNKRNAEAVAIRDEMAKQIPSAASMAAGGATASARVLTLAERAAIPGYKGDFDHFGIDAAHDRLFLAGEDGSQLEVLNLTTGALERRMPGFPTPHSIHVMPRRNEVLVVAGAGPSPILDLTTLAKKRSLALPAGADSAAFDAATGHLWIVTGGKDVPQKDSNLIEIDPATGTIFKKVHFDADHVEALAVEQHGNRIFINVTDKNRLDVIDKTTGTILRSVKIAEAQENAPIAMDEATHRLFVVTRKPGKLIVMNADTLATIASFPEPLRVDQVTWDAANKRIYVPGGQGWIGVVRQLDADHYAALANVPSGPGAKTSILVPSLARFYVAQSPGDDHVGGSVLQYAVAH